MEAYAHRFHLIRTATYDGVQNSEQIVDNLRFTTVKDYEDWLARLDGFPAYVDQNIALAARGPAHQHAAPQGHRRQSVAADRETGHAAARGERLLQAVQAVSRHHRRRRPRPTRRSRLDAVRTRVQPAFASLRTFLEQEYLPACYDRVGWSQTSGGEASYAFFARQFTTTTLSPQQIHEIGLHEVARIRGEMEAIKPQVGFTGTLAEFFTFLRTDPRFFYKTGPELLEGYRALAKRIDPSW